MKDTSCKHIHKKECGHWKGRFCNKKKKYSHLLSYGTSSCCLYHSSYRTSLTPEVYNPDSPLERAKALKMGTNTKLLKTLYKS